MDLNKVTLIGNVVSDPQSQGVGDKSVTRLSVATNYATRGTGNKRKREAVDFHDVAAWGKLGEIIQKYVKKGSKIYIEGRLGHREYTAPTGQRKVLTEIVADNMIMLGHKTARASGESAGREEPDIAEEGV